MRDARWWWRGGDRGRWKEGAGVRAGEREREASCFALGFLDAGSLWGRGSGPLGYAMGTFMGASMLAYRGWLKERDGGRRGWAGLINHTPIPISALSCPVLCACRHHAVCVMCFADSGEREQSAVPSGWGPAACQQQAACVCPCPCGMVWCGVCEGGLKKMAEAAGIPRTPRSQPSISSSSHKVLSLALLAPSPTLPSLAYPVGSRPGVTSGPRSPNLPPTRVPLPFVRSFVGFGAGPVVCG
ncbi:hypothetical protein F5X68DRAFT_55405 [Plectosphaerella plurivora]|uniref:Uncharacterized protein n=1 Tax=Plectosphaerella plurivora TaxID=936078 RepID=A0A9P8UZQ3_9PEZI|nr:hypothetical protein F5X68DRAFT_55405 [Plectosphaerella plurivora]